MACSEGSVCCHGEEDTCRQKVRKLEVAIDRVKFTKKVVY